MALQQDAAPVLVAEDDPEMLTAFREALRAADMTAVGARSARVALDAVAFHRPAVALIDLAMEDGRGWELLYAIAARSGTSILAIDRRGDSLVRRGALAAGADDVISPPFDPEEVTARVRALERRHRAETRGAPVLRHRDLVVDVTAHEVRIGGRPVALTAQQFAILRALCEVGGATLHRAQLLARIASINGEPPSERAVDLHISRLRRRLGDGDGRYIEAVYGVGYRLARRENGAADGSTPTDPVLDALAQPVLVTDERLRIVAANRAAGRLLGRGHAELVGRTCAEVLACRTCDGVALTGPACIGRAALAGDASIAHVRAVVRGASGPLRVAFSHSMVRAADAPPRLAIELRPAD